MCLVDLRLPSQAHLIDNIGVALTPLPLTLQPLLLQPGHHLNVFIDSILYLTSGLISTIEFVTMVITIIPHLFIIRHPSVCLFIPELHVKSLDAV